MSAKIRTYVDASVLINAVIGKNAARKMRALKVLGDPNREFGASAFLMLEVLPIPTKYNKTKEITFYNRFFAGVSWWMPIRGPLIQMAQNLACAHGLGAMDALHLTAAILLGAEFVSAEKPTKPIYSAYARAVSIH